MADPVDQILDEIKPEDTTTEQPKEDVVPKSQFDALQQQLQQLESDPVISQLRANPNLLHDIRAQQIQQTTTPPPTDTSDQYWTDPAKATRQTAEQIIKEQVAPMAQQIGANLVGLYINQFKSTKHNDPFYNVLVSEFDKEIAPLRPQLASYTDVQLDRLFNTVWQAAKGAYVDKRQKERPKDPPANLGGGGSAGGGPKQKRTLREIDEGAWKLAVAGNWTEEEMQKYAEELDGE